MTKSYSASSHVPIISVRLKRVQEVENEVGTLCTYITYTLPCRSLNSLLRCRYQMREKEEEEEEEDLKIRNKINKNIQLMVLKLFLYEYVSLILLSR